jgi:predicted N-acetyltransferase YhbS
MMQLEPSDRVPEMIQPVAKWLYDQWGCHLPGRSIETAEFALKQQPGPDGLPFTLIAVEAGEPVGVARLVASDLEARPDLQPWLASVFVPIRKRSQGIGASVCAGIVKHARELGFPTIYLFTPDRAAFYEKQGWSVMGQESHCDTEVTLMKLELAPRIVEGAEGTSGTSTELTHSILS